MKYTTKDLQNLSKIFSPYSLNFTFPADTKNRAAFGFFGDTDVVKINQENKFITKIYTDGNINLKGFIKLDSISYDNTEPLNFTGSFATSMTNLAERLGDDVIGDLTDEDVSIDWSPSNVFELLQGPKNIDVEGVNVSYFVPLISSTRVLTFDSNIEGPLRDNIAYDSLVTPDSTGTLKANELRPCINFASIINLIKLKYDLEIVAPLDDRKEYSDLVVWCNSKTYANTDDVRLPVLSIYGDRYATDTKNESGIPDPKKYATWADVDDDSFRVTLRDPPISSDNNYTEYFTVKVTFDGVVITGATTEPKVNLKIWRKGTDELLLSSQFELVDTSFTCEIQVPDGLFISNEIEYYITAQFEQPTTWTNSTYGIWYRYYDGQSGWLNSTEYATYRKTSTPNNTSSLVRGTQVDLFKSLPKIKITDFLTSYFKIFNTSVIDTSPTDDRLYWLTPEDINSTGQTYSKAVLDYTPYLNDKTIVKSTSADYNFYDFKHATSAYKSNVDYLTAAGLEYGQLRYPSEKPKNPIPFVVETAFTLMVPVLLFGSNDIITYYGFDSEAPEILDTGESRYSPNYEELTIFYNNGNKPLTNVLGFQSTSYGGTTYNAPLNNYMKVLPFSSLNNSLAFSVLVNQGVEYLESIYKRFYKFQTERLLDPNVLAQEFSIDLPPDEIYLNEATTVQGGGNTPIGFRLQNDIIIKEDLFTILDATIDITTGKTKIKLLNY
jgi:hypothetical protein